MPTQDELDYQEYQQYLKETGQLPQQQQAEQPSAMSKLGEFLTRGLKTPPSKDPNQSLQEYVNSPEMNKFGQDLSKGVAESVAGVGAPGMGFGGGKALSWIGEKTGLSKIPGALMERAVGIKKSIPGAGDILLDKGVGGTGNQMLRQISERLPQEEALIQKELAGMSDPVDSVEVARRVSDSLGKRMTSGGQMASGVEDDVVTILDRAKEIAARGDVSPKQAIEFARKAQENSYKAAKGEVKPGLMPELGASEGQAYKDIVRTRNPAIDQGLKNQQAMIEGSKGLDKKLNASATSNILGLIGKGGTGATLGYALGGSDGALKGAALGLAASPLGLSTAARGARAMGRGVVQTTDPLARLLGIAKAQSTSSPQPTPSSSDLQDQKDYEEYQQYLKEIGAK